MRPLVLVSASSTRCSHSRSRRNEGRRRLNRRQGRRRLGIGTGFGRLVACYLTVLVTLLLVHHHGGSVVAASSSSSSSKDSNSNSDNTTATTTSIPYEWEDLNYYQILGLEEGTNNNNNDIQSGSSSSSQSSSSSSQHKDTASSSITSKDIRKAYRRQAQQWHPDKLVGKRRNNAQQQGQGQEEGGTDANTDDTDANTNPTTTSVEESNARFARIAEAYSVLNNDDTRNDYNRYLRQQQRDQWQEQEYQRSDQHRQQQRHQQHQQRNTKQQQAQQPEEETSGTSRTTWKTKWNDFSGSMQDPLKMFEEFFYGAPEDDDDGDNDNDFWWNLHQQEHGPQGGGSFFGGGSSAGGGAGAGSSSSSSYQSPPYQQHNPNRNDYPIRTYEQEQVWMDPASGREILRILQTNEYEGQQGQGQGQGQVYFQTVAQDFVEEWDRYQGGFSFFPLQREPFVVEEGYRPQSEEARRASSRQRRAEESNSNNNNSNNKQQQQPRGTLASTLLPGSVLVPDNDRPLLQNGRYSAGISSRSCELWIADNVWDTVVWTSETDLLLGHYHPYQQNCQLTLRGSYLVLATVGYPEQLLWYSDADNIDDDYYDDTTAADDSYFARLDSDGSLAVYEKRTVDRCPRWLLEILSSSSARGNEEKPITVTGKWAKPRRVGKTLLRFGRTSLRHVFDRVPSLSLIEPVKSQRSSSSTASSSASLPTLQRLVCVSATGPVGCLGILRPVVKRLRDVIHAVQWVVSKLDRFLETV